MNFTEYFSFPLSRYLSRYISVHFTSFSYILICYAISQYTPLPLDTLSLLGASLEASLRASLEASLNDHSMQVFHCSGIFTSLRLLSFDIIFLLYPYSQSFGMAAEFRSIIALQFSNTVGKISGLSHSQWIFQYKYTSR